MTAQQTTRALATLYVTALSTGNKRRARVISHIMANGAGFYAADRKAQV